MTKTFNPAISARGVSKSYTVGKVRTQVLFDVARARKLPAEL